MEPLLLFVAGFAPGAFWLWYFYRKDKFEREPHGLVLRTAFFGLLSAIPVAFLEYGVEDFVLTAVIVAPVVEELAKFAVVRWSVYNHREFNEPVDGVVYAAAAALGFASIENVSYISEHYYESGAGEASMVFVMRALLSVPGHVLFSSLWGYALGRAKFQDEAHRTRTIAAGLALAMLGHALFNLLLVIGFVFALIFLLLPFLWRRFNRNVDDLLSGSPFKGVHKPTVAGRDGDRKAHDFFLTTAPAVRETMLLPAQVQCPACSADVTLSLNERRRGAYICPSCNTFHQHTNEPAAIQSHPESERSSEPETHSEPEQALHSEIEVEAETMEDANLEPYALPPTMECIACGRTFKLSVAERNRGWFICPGCKYFNAARMPSRFLAAIGEGDEGPRQFFLKPFVVCPACGSELHLEPAERADAAFVCTACGIRTEAMEPEKRMSLKQFILPAEGQCPECEGEFVIEEFFRNHTSFDCPSCRSTIEYVEE